MTHPPNSALIKQELSLGLKEAYAHFRLGQTLLLLLGSILLAQGIRHSFWAANSWPTVTMFGLLTVCLYGLSTGWRISGSKPSLFYGGVSNEQKIWTRLALFALVPVWVSLVLFAPIFFQQVSPENAGSVLLTSVIALLLPLTFYLSGALTSLALKSREVTPARKLAASVYLLSLIFTLLSVNWVPALSATLANPTSAGLVMILGLTSFLAALILLCEIAIRRCRSSLERELRFWRWWPGNPSRTSYSSLETGFALVVSKLLRRKAFMLELAGLLFLLPLIDSLIAAEAGAGFFGREALFVMFVVVYAFLWGVPTGRQLRSLSSKLSFTPLNARSFSLGGYLGSLAIFAAAFLTVGYYLVSVHGDTDILTVGWIMTAAVAHFLATLIGQRTRS